MTEKAENFPPVSTAEAGEKLLRLLVRRLALPESLLHRWLRTGQIRLNGKRAKPFEPVQAGDLIRLPPFALKLNQAAACENPRLPPPDSDLPPLIDLVDSIWAFDKPAGLPVQNGTGHNDSLCARLKAHYSQCCFTPAPAHRLDRETSGVLLVGASHAALSQLQTWFRDGAIHKEYLAWIKGAWPFAGQKVLRHYLVGGDNVTAHEQPVSNGREALCKVQSLLTRNGNSLLQIQLLTGRKRQIRAQLAALGLPVHGDSRYGAKPGSRLKLHALRDILPDGTEFYCMPPWTGAFTVTNLPPVMGQ